MGYLGGVILLVINLVVVMQPKLFGITDGTLPAKIAFLTVFLWWIGFSQLTFKRLPRFTFGHRRPGNERRLRRLPGAPLRLPPGQAVAASSGSSSSGISSP